MYLKQLLVDTSQKLLEVHQSEGFEAQKANLVLVFGQRTLLEAVQPYEVLRATFPQAQIVICSSSGQISNDCQIAKEIVATAIQFEKTKIKTVVTDVSLHPNLNDFGDLILRDLCTTDLQSILILSEGSHVNGTELINELIEKTQRRIPIFGGLAGDEYAFEKTIVGLNQDASSGKIVAVGFYGDSIHFGFGCEGGWGDFGPEREVTASDKNVLYKIGDRYALDLYKEYLGKYAKELPGSSLYFPLSMRENASSTSVVRTILSIDEENKSMTFAGNIPVGSSVRFMKGNTDKLIEASAKAAAAITKEPSQTRQLALLVSCVGRRIVLDERIEEELEIVRETFGNNTLLCGFYSYGEISPTLDQVACELHNQTMTITTLYET